VLGIALDAGFASRSRFYAAFRRAFGCTPSAYRAGRISPRG
jgi:AraC-like DNA-binding protein